MSAKIFVMTHKKFSVPADLVYVPLHVGKACAQDLGYPGDDTGKNISEKNQYYSELTGLYWAAYNETDADVMGLCHYRRFFLDDEGRLLSGQKYEALLSEADVILPKPVYHGTSYYEVYKEAHNIFDLDTTGEVIEEMYPEMYPVFCEIVASDKVYSGNLFVTSRKLFREYADWLFSVFDEVEKRIRVDSYDAYHKRVFGFLSEQLLYVWVKSRGLTICERPVGLTQEKAETMELKQALCESVAKGTLSGVQEALALFRSSVKDRPDLMLQASDFSGELADMFRVIYVCEQELSAGWRGMFSVTSDLSLLVKHYRLLCQIAGKIVRGTESAQERSYFKDSRISETLLSVIAGSDPAIKEAQESLRAFATPYGYDTI